MELYLGLQMNGKKIDITFRRNRARKVKSRIRIRIKVMRIRNPDRNGLYNNFI
jgi:hypothetical protein